MKTHEQAQMLANRLQKRLRHLKKWAQRTGAQVFRLYDRDIPEVPLVLDFYGSPAPETSHSGLIESIDIQNDAALCGALYKRPYEKDAAQEEKWLSAMKESAAAALGIPMERIFLKRRERQKGKTQYGKMKNERQEKIVSEGNISYKVNLSDYLDTGLFPDRRLLRALIRAESAGKKALNLFSYTGSFSVCAAAGGAASTDSVDLSNTYLSWARENFSLNGFSARIIQYQEEFFKTQRTRSEQRTQRMKSRIFDTPQKTQNTASAPSLRPGAMSSNSLIRADALKFLETAVNAKFKWDIIILDPPSFSNSKRMEGTLDLRRDLNALVNYCLHLLNKGGKLFLSINTRHGFNADIISGLSLAPRLENMRIADLTEKMRDEDFKGRKIPKTFLFEI